MQFDKWQQEIIDHEGNVTLRSGRQVGKSTTIAERGKKLMLKYPNTKSLIIAPAQRQSSELFIKIMDGLMIEHERLIQVAGGYKDDLEVSSRRNMELRRAFEQKQGIFAENPTKSMVKLKNGSICYSLPAGKTGVFLRSFTIDFLYIDEAAYVPDPVYNSLKPMLAVPRKKGLGWECFLSTPFGKGGFFYDSFSDDDYKQFHISSEDCERTPKTFLLKEKKRVSTIEYAQEYLGDFIDEYMQYFPTALIKDCMKKFIRWKFKEHYKKGAKYFLGVDYAGPGEDDCAFVDAEEQKDGNLKIVAVETDPEPNTSITNRKIVVRDEDFNYRKILVDSGGFGCGPTDELIKLLGRKVIGINNSKKTVDHEKEKTNKILKEDLYSNAKAMMEQGTVEIISNLSLLRSLKSMRFEYTDSKRLRIYGKDSHLAEAFVRACWAVKTKSLNLYVY